MGPHAQDLTSSGRFFVDLQHLLTGGEFVSTYKFALLLAMVRWALEHPDHPEGEEVDVAEFAGHFAALYWPQVRPFSGGAWAGDARAGDAPIGSAPTGSIAWPDRVAERAAPSILDQDRGGQRPAVVRMLVEEHARGAASLEALDAAHREALLRKVRRTIREMPLWKLQRVGRQVRSFLYTQGSSPYRVVFEPGVVGALARFAPLVEEFVRAAWLRFVLRCNPGIVGTPAAQLEEFLFPSGRRGLGVWRDILVDVQGTDCFYCGRSMRSVAVDHFLPWSRYPRDLGHNFVLAHDRCNADKSAHLASAEHLARWCARNEDRGLDLAARFDEAGVPHDLPALRGVARSLYRIAETAGADVWEGARKMVALDPSWRTVLEVA